MKQLRFQRGTFAGESAIHIVFNRKETRVRLGQMEGFLSQVIYAEDFDDNVETVTELRALKYLVLLCGALLRDESQDGT